MSVVKRALSAYLKLEWERKVLATPPLLYFCCSYPCKQDCLAEAVATASACWVCSHVCLTDTASTP